MTTQLFFDLIRDATDISVHFCEGSEIAAIMSELTERKFALLAIDGASIHSRDELFRAFALALKKPKDWYGDEEYAPNIDAFLEYLDDVQEWIPAEGYVVLINRAEQFWRNEPRLAGLLVECWQFATHSREAKLHLLFVW